MTILYDDTLNDNHLEQFSGNVFVMAAILLDRHLQSVANYLILRFHLLLSQKGKITKTSSLFKFGSGGSPRGYSCHASWRRKRGENLNTLEIASKYRFFKIKTEVTCLYQDICDIIFAVI